MSLKRSNVVKIETKNIIKYDDKLGIHSYGIDNQYPNRMESLIDNSTTGKSCVGIINKFIRGEGFNIPKNLKNIIVGRNGIHIMKLNNLLKRASREISYFNGLFIHLNYNLNYEVSSVSILPNIYTRLGQIDDNGFVNKIYYSEEYNANTKKTDLISFDIYNPDKEIIRNQILKAGGINKYNGQVLYYNFDEYGIYPLSNIDVVAEDADTERQIQIFKNKDLRSGFFTKYLVKTTPFESDQERAAFLKNLKEFSGADNLTPFMLIEQEFNSNPDLDGMKLEEVKQNVDDKIWEHYESSIANNIRKSVGNIPPVLIDSKESALIGGNGGDMIAAIDFMNNQTFDHRETLEGLFQEVFSNYKDVNFRDENIYKIIELGTKNKVVKNENNSNV